MVQCSCLTLKRARCKNVAIHLSLYCHVHQNCAAKVAKGKAKVPAKATAKATAKKVQVKKKSLAAKKEKKKSPPKKKSQSFSPDKKIPDIYDLIELETFTAELS